MSPQQRIRSMLLYIVLLLLAAINLLCPAGINSSLLIRFVSLGQIGCFLQVLLFDTSDRAGEQQPREGKSNSVGYGTVR